MQLTHHATAEATEAWSSPAAAEGCKGKAVYKVIPHQLQGFIKI